MVKPSTSASRFALFAVVIAVCSSVGISLRSLEARQTAATKRQLPTFRVDPAWPKIPSQWALGLVSGVNVDSRDHIWVLHRPRTVRTEDRGKAAPPVLEFDANGNFIRGWGGPGPGFEWPDTEHGIAVDPTGFVWIAGSATSTDHQILKFTTDGRFVLQIGRAGQSKGNADTTNVNGAADVFMYPATNEVFVADGYGNRRVIVFDAETGAFKRMWGAFGNVPADPKPGEPLFSLDTETGDGPPQFNGVHSVRVSNDGIVYVCDRDNQRVQLFSVDGKYLRQIFISRGRMPPSTATGMALGKPLRELEDSIRSDPTSPSRTAFSPDAQQTFLYVLDRRFQRVAILDRKSLEILGYFGDGVGSEPGRFFVLHDLATDSSGNVYTAEVNPNGNRRAQKFKFLGLSTLGH